jgi:hypothetical protein
MLLPGASSPGTFRPIPESLQMIKHIIGVALLGSAIASACVFGDAKAATQIMAGDPSGRNVVFSFEHDGHMDPMVLHIETHRVGNPDAKLSIWIDHSRIRLFSRILTAGDCKYDNEGARCQLLVDGRSPAYRRFVTAFKAGRTAHVEVENAGVMQMRDDISLTGFAKDFRK